MGKTTVFFILALAASCVGCSFGADDSPEAEASYVTLAVDDDDYDDGSDLAVAARAGEQPSIGSDSKTEVGSFYSQSSPLAGKAGASDAPPTVNGSTSTGPSASALAENVGSTDDSSASPETTSGDAQQQPNEDLNGPSATVGPESLAKEATTTTQTGTSRSTTARSGREPGRGGLSLGGLDMCSKPAITLANDSGALGLGGRPYTDRPPNLIRLPAPSGGDDAKAIEDALRANPGGSFLGVGSYRADQLSLIGPADIYDLDIRAFSDDGLLSLSASDVQLFVAQSDC